MKLSRRIGRFRLDRLMLAALLLLGLFLIGRTWLAEHPQHDPWAPLDLNDPPGWATQRKLAALRSDPAKCHEALQRSKVAFESLPAEGVDGCRRADRTVLMETPLDPASPAATCAVGAALELWFRDVQAAAELTVRSRVARIEHLGTYSCRRLYGRDTGPWSEHATGNAVDIAAFVLEDGRRISLVDNWRGTGPESIFLHQVRDRACSVFGTVLSPDYNSAHADHLHFDQEARGFGGLCR